MKKLLILFLFLISLTANASDIQTIKIKDGFLSRVFSKISYCKINPVCYFREKLGSTITTITGTETVSYALKTTANNNFTALNNGKIENSTTTLPLITTLSGLTSAASLATVGTITSGVWSGTAILTAKGGTGSTTLAANQVLLGNGTGNIGIVSGLGTTGQLLTSNGAGSAPTWQTSAVDTTLNYNWTGTYFGAKNLNASSTVANPIKLNGLSIDFPNSLPATTSTMKINESGNVSFGFSATSTKYTNSGIWTKSTKAVMVHIQLWAAGGSGGRGTDGNTADAGGGGGGQYVDAWILADTLSSSETITIGTGGVAQSSVNTAGSVGGNTSFGSILTAVGGSAGPAGTDGQAGGNGGKPSINVSGLWGIGVGGGAGTYGIYSGAGGGAVNDGGGSLYGGGGGGGADDAGGGAGGTSTLGGNGGTGSADGTGVSGSVPGGGGGASDSGTSGAGGNGQAIITTYYF